MSTKSFSESQLKSQRLKKPHAPYDHWQSSAKKKQSLSEIENFYKRLEGVFEMYDYFQFLFKDVCQDLLREKRK